jgi:hypothetical protein
MEKPDYDMHLHRISIKFFAADPSVVDPDSLIKVFHGWIQHAKVPGMLIDVADYRHMADGPGVVLIGHDGDYALDLGGGRPGLLHTQKRGVDGDLDQQLATLLHHALVACRTLANQTPIRFHTDGFRLAFLDRLRAPNTAETFDALRPRVQAALAPAFGDGAKLTLERDASDPRSCLTISAKAPNDPGLDAMIGRLPVAVT